MAKQGRALTEEAVDKIVTLLQSTDMTISEIAQRMGCSRSAIASINRKFQVRDYAGLRSRWSLQKIS
jgi:ribosomal protein S13